MPAILGPDMALVAGDAGRGWDHPGHADTGRGAATESRILWSPWYARVCDAGCRVAGATATISDTDLRARTGDVDASAAAVAATLDQDSAPGGTDPRSGGVDTDARHNDLPGEQPAIATAECAVRVGHVGSPCDGSVASLSDATTGDGLRSVWTDANAGPGPLAGDAVTAARYADAYRAGWHDGYARALRRLVEAG